MTLIVSLRIPDGIVLAGDSLATMMSSMDVQGDADVTCPKCGHVYTATVKLEGQALPATTFPYAQKIFPFLDEFGVGTAGAGQLNAKTIYFIMRELERQIKAAPDGAKRPKTVSDVVELVGDRALKLLQDDIKAAGVDVSKFPDDWAHVEFQIVGYEGDVETASTVSVGKKLSVETHTGSGCDVIGQTNVVTTIWGPDSAVGDGPAYGVFSLQDAIDYAEFLINATASYQRFQRTIPTVGGEIDIALVTPFDKFKWIRQKALHARVTEVSNAR